MANLPGRLERALNGSPLISREHATAFIQDSLFFSLLDDAGHAAFLVIAFVIAAEGQLLCQP